MMKNKMMRIASVLLVAVLLSTCVISGTFAKYTTKATATDAARVAHWGFEEPTAVTFDLFKHGDGNVIATVGDDDIIAPGTSASATLNLTFGDNGSIVAPEVAYNYSFAATATGSYNALDDNTNFVWTLGANEYQTFDQFAAAVAAMSEDVAAGDLPAVQSVTIGWEWKFVEDDAANTTDTAMGNATTLDNIAVTLTITATQID